MNMSDSINSVVTNKHYNNTIVMNLNDSINSVVTNMSLFITTLLILYSNWVYLCLVTVHDRVLTPRVLQPSVYFK